MQPLLLTLRRNSKFHLQKRFDKSVFGILNRLDKKKCDKSMYRRLVDKGTPFSEKGKAGKGKCFFVSPIDIRVEKTILLQFSVSILKLRFPDFRIAGTAQTFQPT